MIPFTIVGRVPTQGFSHITLSCLLTLPLPGSTVVTPYDDLTPIELGASVFVKANKNMWRAVDEFGLERTGFDDEKEVMGIWDGEQFPLTVRPGLHAVTFAPRLTRTPDGRD